MKYFKKVLGRWVGMLKCDYFIEKYKAKFRKYSSAKAKRNGCSFIRFRIIMINHAIEKGLSHSNFRAGFGRIWIEELCRVLDIYMNPDNSEIDDFAVQHSISLLALYHKKNMEHEFDDSEYLPLKYQKRGDDGCCLSVGGVKEICPKDVVSISDKVDFEEFSWSRVSVRLYDYEGLNIDKDDILKCIQIAGNAPSACNRQSISVYVITNRNLFPKIEEIQKGCTGFGKNASAFILIANDLSLFGSKDYKLPVFDSGLFTLNLVYALQSQGIFSCILNAFELADKQKWIHEQLGIPFREDVNGLIALYKLKPDDSILVCASPRRDVKDYTHFI